VWVSWSRAGFPGDWQLVARPGPLLPNSLPDGAARPGTHTWSTCQANALPPRRAASRRRNSEHETVTRCSRWPNYEKAVGFSGLLHRWTLRQERAFDTTLISKAQQPQS